MWSSFRFPSYISMLTGTTPSQHGVTWNSDRTEEFGTIDTPTMSELAKKSGFTTAAFFSKSKFRYLQKAGTLDHMQASRGGELWMATRHR